MPAAVSCKLGRRVSEECYCGGGNALCVAPSSGCPIRKLLLCAPADHPCFCDNGAVCGSPGVTCLAPTSPCAATPGVLRCWGHQHACECAQGAYCLLRTSPAPHATRSARSSQVERAARPRGRCCRELARRPPRSSAALGFLRYRAPARLLQQRGLIGVVLVAESAHHRVGYGLELAR